MNMTKIAQIIRKAGKIALEYEGENCKIDYKPDGTLVSDADKLIGEFITLEVQKLYPDYLIIQEETVDPKIHTPERLAEGYVVVVDPIDGTTSFREAFHSWGILLGLLHNGKPIEGIAYYPRYNEMFFTRNGKTFLKHQQFEKELNVLARPDYRKSQQYQEHRMKSLIINVDPLAFQRFDFSKFSGRIFVQTGVYAFTVFARGMSSCLLVTPGLDLTDLAAGFAIVNNAGGELRYLSGELVQLSDLFHLNGNDRDIIACPKGEFDNVIRHFVQRS